MQILVIGDIHGCLAELYELLDAAALGSDDVIISLGDLIDRGPDSPGVLHFFRTHPRARAIQGNHERKHVRALRGLVRPALSQQITRRRFEEHGDALYDDAIAWMDALPRFIDLPDALLVHGFFEPGVPLTSQRENVLVGTMTGEKWIRARCGGRPWYKLYDGDKPLVVGHLDYLRNGQPLVWRNRVYGIDTACVQGGRLTGLILPAFRVVSVPAQKNWWNEERRCAVDLRYADNLLEALSFDALRAQTEVGGERGRAARALLEHAEVALVTLHGQIACTHAAIRAGLAEGAAFGSLAPADRPAVMQRPWLLTP